MSLHHGYDIRRGSGKLPYGNVIKKRGGGMLESVRAKPGKDDEFMAVAVACTYTDNPQKAMRFCSRAACLALVTALEMHGIRGLFCTEVCE